MHTDTTRTPILNYDPGGGLPVPGPPGPGPDDGTVTSVGLSTDVTWLVAEGDNPVTTAGVLELNANFTGTGNVFYLDDAGNFTAPPGGGGSVTSVGLSTDLSWLQVSGSPVVGAGTLELDGNFTGSGTRYLDDSGTFSLIPIPVNHQSILLSGGGVAWTGTGLNFTVSAATYLINGVEYTSPQTNITLAAADPSLNRIDTFAVTGSSTAIAITGTPGGPPLEPQVDPATQLRLTTVSIVAGAIVPAITTENLYLENTEWTSAVTANVNAASTTNPFAGVKCIEGTNTVATNGFTLTKPSGTLSLGDFASLVLQLRSKAAWSKTKAMSLIWQNGITNVGTTTTIKDGTFGFNSSNTTDYQQIVIPVNLFNTGVSLINKFVLQVTGGGAAIGWHIDNIVLQSILNTAGGGDFSTNTNVAVAGEVVLFADTTGKLGKRSTATGITQMTSGVMGTVTVGTGLSYVGTTLSATATAQTRAVTFVCDGSGLSLSSGTKSYVKIPYGGTLTGWLLIGSPSGSVTVDIFRAADGAGLPVTSIVGAGTKPSLSSAVENSSTTFTSWTSTTLTAKDNLAISVSGVTSTTYLALTLYFT
jgi:hypothetical protein